MVLVARHAMATRFEIALHGANEAALRAAGDEALDEIDRLENLLSLYRGGTDIARANALACGEPVRLTPEVFRLLQRAQALSVETQGAFDITVAPLVRCWGFMNGTGSMPNDDEIAAARACVGMDLLELDANEFTIRFRKPGVMLDLGAIGKGYAIDRAAKTLRDAGVTSALIHGGTSSTYAIGRQPDGTPWKVAITSPAHDGREAVATVELEDESLSVSAVWGRSFRAREKTYGHVINPVTGRPTEHALLTALVLPSATDGDALTTALMTRPALLSALHTARPAMKSLVITGSPEQPQIRRRGL